MGSPCGVQALPLTIVGGGWGFSVADPNVVAYTVEVAESLRVSYLVADLVERVFG